MTQHILIIGRFKLDLMNAAGEIPTDGLRPHFRIPGNTKVGDTTYHLTTVDGLAADHLRGYVWDRIELVGEPQGHPRFNELFPLAEAALRRIPVDIHRTRIDHDNARRDAAINLADAYRAYRRNDDGSLPGFPHFDNLRKLNAAADAWEQLR